MFETINIWSLANSGRINDLVTLTSRNTEITSLIIYHTVGNAGVNIISIYTGN